MIYLRYVLETTPQVLGCDALLMDSDRPRNLIYVEARKVLSCLRRCKKYFYVCFLPNIICVKINDLWNMLEIGMHWNEEFASELGQSRLLPNHNDWGGGMRQDVPPLFGWGTRPLRPPPPSCGGAHGRRAFRPKSSSAGGC